MLSALLFLWLQRAGFYVDVHRYALSRIPEDLRGTWIEVGCGPGLFSRMAAARGFSGAGYDPNKYSIAIANRLSAKFKGRLRFKAASIDDLRGKTATVVAAASLLAVLPDKQRGLLDLWEMVEPGGILLIIEPTATMTVQNANALIASGNLPARGESGLRRWATARQGRTVPVDTFEVLQDHLFDYSETLDGMVGVWVFGK